MLPSKIYTLTLTANSTQNLLVAGEYFKILGATGAIDVLGDFGKIEGIGAGQGLEKTPFRGLTFTDRSGSSNTLRIFIGDENFIDGLTGNVAITTNKAPTVSSPTNTAATVTNGSGLLMSANVNRQKLLIQNKDASGTLYLSYSSPATALNGIRVVPGGNYEPAVTETCAIYAIGDIASNVNILVVEG